MNPETCIDQIDSGYIVDIRRRLHIHPEIGFELPKTLELIKAELDALGIPYTEKYGRSSLVAQIGKSEGFTIGIRADMDALPIQETNDIPFKSEVPGAMHACGHDAHTAMLLGAAKALKGIEKDLACRVKLIFQACEEGEFSGARLMVNDGVMDDIDVIIGQHVENWLDSGKIGVCPGSSMAASHPITVDFTGKAAHATLPQSGADALAMAVKAYNDIQFMLSREIDPFQKYVCSIGTLNAGKTVNVIADSAQMKMTLRTYDMKLDEFIVNRIRMIADHAAEELGGSAKVHEELKAYPLYNNIKLSKLLLESAAKVVGTENIAEMPIKMSSEDFSFYVSKKPGVFFRLGTRNEAKGCTTLPHNNNFMIDEDAFVNGSRVFVRFVLDNMGGIEMKEGDI